MSIASSDAEGKVVKFTVSGNQVGTANVVVKATMNGKDSVYTVPVKVTKVGVLNSVTYTVDRSKMTDAIDTSYYGTSTVKAYDSNGKLLSALDYDVTFALNDEEKAGAVDDETADLVPDDSEQGFTVDNVTGEYTAYAATSGKKTIKVTVSQDDIVKEKAANVTVDKLLTNIWNHGDNDSLASVTYKVELEKSTLAAMDASGEDVAPYMTTARLAAYVNSKFAGYVYNVNLAGFDMTVIGTANAATTGAEGHATGVSTGSAIRVTSASGIDNGSMAFGVKYGTKYAQATATGMPGVWTAFLGASAINYGDDPTAIDDTFGAAVVTMMNPAFLAGGGVYVSGDSSYDTTFAKPGAYTVEFRFNQNNGAKVDQKVTAKLTVQDAVAATTPKVTVTSRNVSSMSKDDIIGNMTTLVDMNNNTSAHDSIVGLYSDPVTEITDFNKDSLFVKYVAVVDNVEGQNLTYFVPINKTFYVK